MAGYVKFKRWEKEIYLQGYKDGWDKREPRLLPLPKPLIKPSSSYDTQKKSLRIIAVIQENPNDSTAETIWTKAEISKGTFYLLIKPLLNQGLIIKDVSTRPVLYKIAPKEIETPKV